MVDDLVGVDRAELDRRGLERRSRQSFRNPERRSGFDRRVHYRFTGALRDDPALLLGVLVLVNALSTLDFAFTYLQLQAGMSAEGNPLLAELFAKGTGRAWLFKTGAMLIVSWGVWRGRNHRAVLGVAVGTLFLYVAIIAYHLLGMSLTG